MSRREATIALALLALVCAAPSARAQPPGPERFAKAPETPEEYWQAIDYLVRSGQVEQAVPYLKTFLNGNPSDEVLLGIRDRFGAGSILRLGDFPATRAAAAPLVRRLNEASIRSATRPDRLEQAIAGLSQSREDQDYGVDQLREAGPAAVPAMIRALRRPGNSPEDSAAIAEALGRLEPRSIPPLIATLAAGSVVNQVDAARALGRIGDPRAVPPLSYLAASTVAPPEARNAARDAIGRLTGRSYAEQPRSAVRVLAADARAYHLHKVPIEGNPPLLWTWDEAQGVPVGRAATPTEIEEALGLRSARAALALDPTDAEAQTLLISIALEKAAGRAGPGTSAANDPSAAFDAALQVGPEVLGRVLDGAITDGKYGLAAASAEALGRVVDRGTLARIPRPHPLVRALSAPDRRTQFAAAKALVDVRPRGPFPGSSRVVPVLARFVASGAEPKAIVIDGNLARGGQLAGNLRAVGYDPEVARTGDEGFALAAGSADVELVIIEPNLIEGAWRLTDTLANLRADARTAGLPILLVGPLDLADRIGGRVYEFPGVEFLVTPATPQILKTQLDRLLARMGARPLGEAERAALALEASTLLGKASRESGSPYEADLPAASLALAKALKVEATGRAAVSALGDLPGSDVQRGLADAVLDPSRGPELRLDAADQLARSVQRFGPLLTGEQERQLLGALDGEADPALRRALAGVLGALRPEPDRIGRRLQAYQAPAAPAPAAETPAP